MVLAQYGKLKREELESKAQETNEDEEQVIDVTIPVQYRSKSLNPSLC